MISTNSVPAAAPVASAGVSIPPVAPARRNTAVRRGFRIKTAAAVVRVIPLARLAVRIDLPLPGSSGHQCEQTPINNPAAAIAGISSQDRVSAAPMCRRNRRD